MEEERIQAAQPAPASHFDGNTLQLLLWRLLAILLSLITLGIGAPWAHCMLIRWQTKHTVVEGRRLHFDGRGHQLLGKYLLWGLLTAITLGIYAIFLPVRMEKWRVSHTRFAAEGEYREESDSGIVILAGVLAGILLLALLFGGIYLAADHWEDITEAILPAQKEPEKPDSEGIIQDSQGNIIYIPVETLPIAAEEPSAEPTTADGVWLPRPDDDEDFWYVNNSKDGLNLRYGPGTEYDVIRNLPHGTEVEVLDWENGWAFTGDGWLAGNYLEINPPKDAVKKSIVGHWGLIREWPHEWSDDWYYVVMFRFYGDGTFTSQTAGVSYGTVGGSDSWVPEGLQEESSFSGTYTYKDGVLKLQYDDGWTEKTSASWNGKQLKLDNPEAIRTHWYGNPTGKIYTGLIPLEEEVDLYFDLPSIVSRYVG